MFEHFALGAPAPPPLKQHTWPPGQVAALVQVSDAPLHVPDFTQLMPCKLAQHSWPAPHVVAPQATPTGPPDELELEDEEEDDDDDEPDDEALLEDDPPPELLDEVFGGVLASVIGAVPVAVPLSPADPVAVPLGSAPELDAVPVPPSVGSEDSAPPQAATRRPTNPIAHRR